MKNFLLFVFCLLIVTSAYAVRLPAVISDNMVLQQKTAVKIWGWGNPTEKILVTSSWSNTTDSVLTDGDGKWQLNLQTPAAGGPYTIIVAGYNTIVLKNIMIGEVWVCSGQSNMEMNYNWGIPQMKEDLPSAYNPHIRLFNIPRTTAEAPQEDLSASWSIADSNTVKNFSAIAYYFGKKLNHELNVPVGLVLASWGGTTAEVWTPAEIVLDDAVLKDASQKIKPSNDWPVQPGLAYNGMIAPLTNFSIAGAIWYQGESNVETASTYHQLFSSMIRSWRNHWNKDFPFYFVQLAPYHYGNKNVAALIREAQLKTLVLPNTGLAPIHDFPVDTTDIHPKAKKQVGERLASLILNNVYGSNTKFKTPVYQSMAISGNKVLITIKDATGLVADGKNIRGFEVAGADKKFYPAQGKLSGHNIIVSSKAVATPVAVRYAFSNTAMGNVMDKSGMPLAPFRTDDWEVDTSRY